MIPQQRRSDPLARAKDSLRNSAPLAGSTPSAACTPQRYDLRNPERMRSFLKRLLVSGVISDAGLAALAPFRRHCASILFLHRFAVPDLGVIGHDPAILREHLEYLRARRYRLMSLSELIEHLEQKIPLDEFAVVFTVDDGYADFAEIAGPVFAAYDCPVTVFLITDFVSGKLWNWFDKVDWLFRECHRHSLDLQISGETLGLRWKNVLER